MYTSDRNGSHEIRSFKTFFTVTMLVASAVVFFGLQVMMVGPLKTQLETIQSRLDDTEHDMRKLVAERNQLWKTNDLLTALKDQAESVEDIRETLVSIRTLRQQVEKEAQQTQRAMVAFDSIVSLHKQLAAQDNQTQLALTQFDDLVALRQSVIDSAKDTDNAMKAIEDIGELTAAAVITGDKLGEAEDAIDTLAELKYRMLGETDGLVQAEKNIDRIAALNKKLVIADITTAEENANRLLVINDSLAGTETDEAGKSLDSLLAMESRLAANGDRAAKAVVALQAFDDFQAEVTAQMKSVEGVRRTLVEVAMLETSIGRVARVLKPLAELTGLRSLSERDMQEVIQAVRERRTTRISQNTPIVDQEPVAEKPLDGQDENLVPKPPQSVIDEAAE